MLAAALCLVVGLYGGFVVAVALRARRAMHTAAPAPLPDDALPQVAVLVAARDEERTLPRCLAALLAQDYPADRLEIVVADDHSTDGTAAVVARFRARAAGAAPVLADFEGEDEAEPEPSRPLVRYVRVPDPAGPLRGKAQAIHTAVGATTADLLLLTDADCAPPPGWARAMAGYLADANVGMVCGRTDVAAPRAGGALAAAQALDWTFLLTTASVMAEAGLPATAMGNNMGLRRAAYERVGGYPALPFSVTEDYALFRAVAARSGFVVRFPLDPALAVQTLPLGDVRAVYRQRKRWARGGASAPAAIYAVCALAHLAHLLPLLALPVASAAALGALAAKAAADLALLAAVLPPARRPLLRAFGAFEALLFGYLATLPAALLLAPRVRWKGRTH